MFCFFAYSCPFTLGGDPREDTGSWISEPTRRESATSPANPHPPGPVGTPRPHSPSPYTSTLPPATPSTPGVYTNTHGRSISISVVPCSDHHRPHMNPEDITDAFLSTPATPPVTPPSKRRTAKNPRTPPPPSRKLLQLLPNITLTRSKSHESQLANRIEEPASNK